MENKLPPSPRRPQGTVRRGVLVIVAFLTLAVSSGMASVLVAPTAVYLTETDRTGRMTIQNPTDEPKEISVYFSFGLPESDSLGNVYIKLLDSNETDPRSAASWLKVFPRKFVLAPRGSQVIRFVARPPKDLDDGEYWARIVIRSQESQISLPMAGKEDAITTKLNMIMQTAIILKYRTGNLVAKIDVTAVWAKQEDSTVHAFIDMVNRGNVSYVGTLICRLLDADKREISRDQVNLAVYRSLLRRFDLPIKPGNFRLPYQVDIVINNEGRKDIPPEGVIAGNTIHMTAFPD